MKMETLAEIGINVILLQEQLKHYMEINELQHGTILDKLVVLDSKIVNKHTECDTKFIKLEKGYDNFKEWKIYNIALIAFLGLILPYILNRLFGV